VAEAPVAEALVAEAPVAEASVEEAPAVTEGAAWAAHGKDTGRTVFRRVLIDFRAFYSHREGEPAMPHSRGMELLSYIDLVEGMSAAAVYRMEFQDELGQYGALMMVPTLTPTVHAVFSLGGSDGAPFFPQVRFDTQVRGLLPGKLNFIMYDVGATCLWWGSDSIQVLQSDSLIFWRQPFIFEMRGTVSLLFRGPAEPEITGNGVLVFLYGSEGEHWLIVRGGAGNLANAQALSPVGRSAMEQPSSDPVPLTITGGASYRRWLGPHYGFMAEFDFLIQPDARMRLGGTASIFVDF